MNTRLLSFPLSVPLVLALVGLLAVASCQSPSDPEPSNLPKSSTVSVAVQAPANVNEALSFSASSVTATVGQAIEVTPTFVTGATDWRWYVNGVEEATTSSLSYTPTTAGHYTISVTVSYNGVLYSGSVTATVAN